MNPTVLRIFQRAEFGSRSKLRLVYPQVSRFALGLKAQEAKSAKQAAKERQCDAPEPRSQKTQIMVNPPPKKKQQRMVNPPDPPPKQQQSTFGSPKASGRLPFRFRLWHLSCTVPSNIAPHRQIARAMARKPKKPGNCGCVRVASCNLHTSRGNGAKRAVTASHFKGTKQNLCCRVCAKQKPAAIARVAKTAK